MRALTAYQAKCDKKEVDKNNRLMAGSSEIETIVEFMDCAPTEASIGGWRMLSAARASTNGETVGAVLAAFSALGNNIFQMSHETVNLPLRHKFNKSRGVLQQFNRCVLFFSIAFLL